MKNFLLLDNSQASIKVVEIKYFLLLIFCFFPYLNIFHLGTDTQPNALIFAVLILLANPKKKLPRNILYFIIVLYVAVIMLLLSSLSFRSFLSFSNYLSILVVPIAVFLTLQRYKGLSFKLFKWVVIIWGVVGIIQKFIL